MSEFGPEPSDEARARQREQWVDSRDTGQRVRDVLVGVREPASAAEIADFATCSATAARKHLNELAEIGVARRLTDGQSTRYVRNEEYFRWRRADELATEHTVEELFDRLSRLEAKNDEFRDEYGVDGPSVVEFPDDADHERLHDTWEAVGEWATVRQQIGLHRDALRIARRRSDELPA